MKNKAVIGLGFGDEGKGLVTNYLCMQAIDQLIDPLVIRFSGGQQAGHTVRKSDGVSHVFSNFGSGTLSGIPTYWSKYCSVHPLGVVNELEALKSLGVSPKLLIDERSPLTTPFEIKNNQLLSKGHGTCGVGVGETFKREEEFYSFTFGDLFFHGIIERKLELIKNRYRNILSKDDFELAESNLPGFIEHCFIMMESNEIKRSYTMPDNSRYQAFDSHIFEGSQGLMLDQHIGYFPHVTRSNTGSTNLGSLTFGAPVEYWLVTRAYQTRHGNGPMSNEHIPHNIKDDPEETNITNEWQGDFRRALLDVDQLLYAISRDHVIRSSKRKKLVITCLDHIENDYRYTKAGKIVYCNNAEDFSRRVAEELSIEEIFISTTPYSNLIQKLK